MKDFINNPFVQAIIMLLVFAHLFLAVFNTFFTIPETKAVQTGDGYELIKEDLEVD